MRHVPVEVGAGRNTYARAVQRYISANSSAFSLEQHQRVVHRARAQRRALCAWLPLPVSMTFPWWLLGGQLLRTKSSRPHPEAFEARSASQFGTPIKVESLR